MALALLFLLLPLLFFGYAYLGYPMILWLVAARREPYRLPPSPPPEEWPFISITVPCYNEAASIRSTLESVLALDYPEGRRQILVVSDASTDATDRIVADEFFSRGVELLRMPERRGKTAIENAAAEVVHGEIVVNIDASIRVLPASLKPLIRAFGDSTVGVASGRDVSVGDLDAEANSAESGYVGYEMWVRSMETRLGSIVGASGCFYGTRSVIHDSRFPEGLSRDFACALIAREHGYRAVSVEQAICLVSRATSLKAEFRRKIRTMARGLQTLWYKRQTLNPFRYGGFALMLMSHKLCRWLFYLTLPLAAVALVALATQSRAALGLLFVLALGTALGAIGIWWPSNRRVPRLFSIPGFILASNLAGMIAWLKVFRGEQAAQWEPTRRPA